MKKVQVLPNLVTIGNLMCGFCAICTGASFLMLGKIESPDISKIFEQKSANLLHISFALIFLGMVFDAFDGKVARMTNSISEFGAELDSLADAVTFGVAPAFLSFIMLYISDYDIEKFKPIYLLPSLFVICAILRLARYNVDRNEPEKDKGYFTGLPTPAGAAALVSLLWLQVEYSILKVETFRFAVLFMSVLIGFFEVSKIKYLHLGQKILKEPKSMYVIPVVILVLYLLLNYAVLSLFVISYGYLVINTLIEMIVLIKKKKLYTAFEDDSDDVV